MGSDEVQPHAGPLGALKYKLHHGINSPSFEARVLSFYPRSANRFKYHQGEG